MRKPPAPQYAVLCNGFPSDADGATVRWKNEIVLVGATPADMALEVQQDIEYRYGIASRVAPWLPMPA